MKTVARIATWIDAVATTVIAYVLRTLTAVLTLVLRRGPHRSWRRRGAEARRSARLRG